MLGVLQFPKRWSAVATHDQVGAEKQVEITIRIPMVDKVMERDNSAPSRSADLCQSLGWMVLLKSG
ncbi:MAG: hypothetical protein CMQ29_05440 [Gammaproteobacteria bacterium]|nr:hypothetical protein [Gammaproteobacteria bacterium]